MVKIRLVNAFLKSSPLPTSFLPIFPWSLISSPSLTHTCNTNKCTWTVGGSVGMYVIRKEMRDEKLAQRYIHCAHTPRTFA